MRQVWVFGATSLLLLLGVSGCNSKSPLDAGQQTVSIALEARAQAYLWNIWDIDGNPNAPYCQQYPSAENPDVVEAPVAWPLIVEISEILPGSVDAQVIATSIGTANEFSSITPYDDRVVANLLDTVVGGLPAVNGRRVTSGSLDYLIHCGGANHLGFPADILPAANLLGAAGTFDIPVEQGTTIIVRAREQFYDNSFPLNDSALVPPALSGYTFVDGVEAIPDGTSFVSDEDGGGFTFSIRVR